MSKLGDKVLTEKTRVLVTLSNFFMLVFAIVSGVVFVVNWKAEIENRISNTEEDVIELIVEVEEGKRLQIETQTQLAEIQTDLKWIRAYMEKDE